MFLVPAQYTLQAEIEIMTRLNLEGTFLIDVLSPGRLQGRVFERAGQPDRVIFDERGKCMVLSGIIEQERERIAALSVPKTPEIDAMLVSRETSPLEKGVKMIELLRRPQINYEALAPFDKTRPDLPFEVFEQIEIDIKYEGYIRRQQQQINELHRLEVKRLPDSLDYNDITGLRLEAIEKLSKIRPETVGQASRISGVSPADISVLLIYLERNGINVN